MLTLGKLVTWKSQAGGTSKVKTGVITEVVPAGFQPKKYRDSGKSNGRSHESYIVSTNKHDYWPVVSLLKERDVKDETWMVRGKMFLRDINGIYHAPCPHDTDGDGNCPIHPTGCPGTTSSEETAVVPDTLPATPVLPVA